MSTRALSLAAVLLTGCSAAPEGAAPLVGASPAPTSAPAPEPSQDPARPEFSPEMAMAHVRVLAGRIGRRPAGSRSYRRAARYVRDELVELGYRARLQPFVTGAGDRSWNVVASWPGSKHRLLLGAHLDTVPPAPGGNDNASGVAVLLELARVLAASPEGFGVRLVAFGAEERQPDGGHHEGSLAYVDRMRRRPRRMVSVDMIGKPKPIIVGWMGIGRKGAVRGLRAAGRVAGVPTRARVLPDVSDNGPFERAGVASALMWTGTEPAHHSARDVTGNVSKKALGRAGRLLLAWIDREAG